MTNTRLVYAMKHQTRAHSLSVLTDRTASPKQIAAELGRDVPHVAYHIRILKKLGLVELARIDPAAGGRVSERFYRATQRAWFDREAWKAIGGSKSQSGMTAAVMGLINEDIATAITGGTFDGDDNHISRTPLLLDRESHGELIELMTDTLASLFDIRAKAANRMKPDTETVSTMVHLIQFDMPKPNDRS